MYRGKRKDTGEVIYGELIKIGCTELIGQLEIPCYDGCSIGCGVEDRGCTDRYEGAEYGYNQAIEDIFQNAHEVVDIKECVGLKDKNGVELCEGDKFISGVVWIVEKVIGGFVYYNSKYEGQAGNDFISNPIADLQFKNYFSENCEII